MTLLQTHTKVLFCTFYLILFTNVYGADIHNTSNCTTLSFAPNLVLMLMYFLIVCSAGYCYGRHRGEYIHETKLYHKIFMCFMSYILLYIIILSWIYYNFFHSSNNINININYIAINFPWLTLYGISYIFYSTLSTFTFAYHSNYHRSSKIQLTCLLCTLFPLGLAILTFFLFQTSEDISQYKLGLFDYKNNTIPFCFNIDLLSLTVSCLLIIAFFHHIYVLLSVFYSMIKDKKVYLSHPHAYRGKVSNISRSTTHCVGRQGSQKIYGNVYNKRYVYKSEDSDSENIEQNERQIEINVQVPIDDDIDDIDDIDQEAIELNHSVDIRRSNSAFTAGSLSYDL
eukprot:553881_1